MIKHPLRRMAVTAVAAALSAGGMVALAAAPAAAHAVPIPTAYNCASPLGSVPGPTTVTITAADTATAGDSLQIEVGPSGGGSSSPVPLPAGAVYQEMDLVVEGASPNPLLIKGATNPDPIPAGTPIVLPPMKGTLSLGAAGTVKLKVGTMRIHTNLGGDIVTTCTLTSSPSESHDTVVGAAGPTLGAFAAARPGDTVPVTGAGWPAGSGTAEFCDASATTCAGAGTVTADAGGNLTGSAAVPADASPGPHAIKVTVGAASKSGPIEVKPKDEKQLQQQITVAVQGAGGLEMEQAGETVSLPPVTLNGADQHTTGAINQVTVKDFRSVDKGWDLTGTMTALSGTAGSIPAANLKWTPQCATVTGTGNPTAGPPAAFTGALKLCTQAPGSVTTGSYHAGAGLDLLVPGTAGVGTYAGTLTLSLV